MTNSALSVVSLTTTHDNSRQQLLNALNRTFEHKSTGKYMHKSHMHPNHFTTVEKIVFLSVQKVFLTPNLVTYGNIRHVVFRRTWTIPLPHRGDTICKMIIYHFMRLS